MKQTNQERFIANLRFRIIFSFSSEMEMFPQAMFYYEDLGRRFSSYQKCFNFMPIKINVAYTILIFYKSYKRIESVYIVQK